MKSKTEKIIDTIDKITKNIARDKARVLWRIKPAPPGQVYRLNGKHNFS